MRLVSTVASGSSLWRWVLPLAILLTVLGCWGVALLLPLTDPYVQSVRSLVADVKRGEQIYIMNCAGCHGLEGKGQVGPTLIQISRRRSQPQLIHQIVSGETPPMPKFQAQPQDMADLLSYLKTL
ncbi:c-type cytochrome [Parathermosynechococcus lividus]|uniref:Cytochrome n=1 Tax=Parathermosynechococcus lividus PCC 6715 TaxID=1917166 RepID=A0A2D2Q425_PARLV|nr:cytochrome c [Thermostichus lividus]ATS19242.1 cytochrome [Thermostichus lividus PCC 6715]